MTNSELKRRIENAISDDGKVYGRMVATGVTAKTAQRIVKHILAEGYKPYCRPARHSGFADIEAHPISEKF